MWDGRPGFTSARSARGSGRLDSGGPATGQQARPVDPKTGAIKEYTLKSAFTGPHAWRGQDGNIWFYRNNAALIGKLDPNTGVVTEYPLPDANAKDPHTSISTRAECSGSRCSNRISSAGLIRDRRDQSSSPRRREVASLWADVNAQAFRVRRIRSNKIATIDPKTLAIKDTRCPARMRDRAASRSVPTA